MANANVFLRFLLSITLFGSGLEPALAGGLKSGRTSTRASGMGSAPSIRLSAPVARPLRLPAIAAEIGSAAPLSGTDAAEADKAVIDATPEGRGRDIQEAIAPEPGFPVSAIPPEGPQPQAPTPAPGAPAARSRESATLLSGIPWLARALSFFSLKRVPEAPRLEARSPSRSARLAPPGLRARAPSQGLSPVANRGSRQASSSFARGLRAAAAAILIGALYAAMPSVALGQDAGGGRPPAEASVEDADYVQSSDINDVLRRWSPEVPLYVIGAVRQDNAALRHLSGWLKGRHWTVVLVGDSSGQAFVDRRGQRQFDADAVDYGTGQGIGGLPAFMSQIHSATGEPDGAIFTISFNPQRLYYSPSPAHEKRGLGQAAFRSPGKDELTGLDQWARRAWARNMDILSMVKDTVSHIDQRLEEAISRESQSAQSSVAEAARELDKLESSAAAFSKSYPWKAQTAWNDFPGLRTRLKAAQDALKAGRLADARRDAAAVLAAVQDGGARMQSYIGAYAGAGDSIKSAQERVGALQDAGAEAVKHAPALKTSLEAELRALNDEIKEAESLLQGDPQRAQALAEAAHSRSTRLIPLVQAYPSGRLIIERAEAHLQKLHLHPMASAAKAELGAASKLLDAAREAYEKGALLAGRGREAGFAYLGKIAELDRAASAAEQALSRAEAQKAADEAAARRAALRFWLFLALGVLSLGALLLGLHLFRARPAFREAVKFYKDWDKILKDRIEALQGNFEHRLQLFAGAYGRPDKGYTGRTQALAEEIRQSADILHMLWGQAHGILEKAKAKIYPAGLRAWIVNKLSPYAYREAVHLLKDKPIEFDPKTGIPDIFGKGKTFENKLYGKPEDYKPFTGSFDDLIEKYNGLAARANDGLKRIERALFESEPAFAQAAASVAMAAGQKPAVEAAAKEDGLFLAPSLFATLLPAAQKALERAREVFKTDPVAAAETNIEETRRMVEQGSAIASFVLKARREWLPAAFAAVKSLEAAQVSTAWIEESLANLSAGADALAAKAAEASVAGRLQALETEVSGLPGLMGRALGSNAAREAALKGIAEARAAVIEARQRIAAALGLDADKTLREKDSDPSEFLDQAQAKAAAALKSLGRGSLDAVDKALQETSGLCADAGLALKGSLDALAGYEARAESLRDETLRIEGLLPEHQRLLASIESDFAASVLSLGAGDAAHPSANGSVADNAEEASSGLSEAAKKLERSRDYFRSGKLLGAASLLRQASAAQETALHRLSEIKEKRGRLDAAMAANAQALPALDGRLKEYRREYGADRRAQRPTLRGLDKARELLSEAREAVEAAKGDPFRAAERLKILSAQLDAIHAMARNDRDLHAEAQRSLAAASKQLAAARALSREAGDDGIEDSAALDAAQAAVNRLGDALASAQRAFAEDHGEWGPVDREADRIAAEAAQAAATLRKELAEGREAADEVSKAAGAVRDAAGRTFAYGVYIHGSPGGSELDAARRSLREGRYGDARRLAGEAEREAKAAIAMAEAEVSARREAEAEKKRQEEAARQALRDAELERQRKRKDDSDSPFGGGGGRRDPNPGGSIFGGGNSGNAGSIFAQGGGASGNASSDFG